MNLGQRNVAVSRQGLRGAVVMYVFLETRNLDEQRRLLEAEMKLPVIEIEPHLPHERHGVVKYDAGNLILSLNISTPSRFASPGSDALVIVFGCAQLPHRLEGAQHVDLPEGRLFRDGHGHLYLFRQQAGLKGPIVNELRLAAPDLGEAQYFYQHVLGLDLIERSARSLRFGTASVDLVLEQTSTAMDGQPLRRHNHLLVFHAADVESAWSDLCERGASFKSSRVGYSEIGGTIRLEDPLGTWLCLYQPSPTVLEWGSGPKVSELAARAAAA